jgi:hypothetical protein
MNRIYNILIIFLCVCLFAQASIAYEVDTHEELTERTV